MSQSERKVKFVRALAEFLGGTFQVEASVSLGMNKEWAKHWGKIRGETPSLVVAILANAGKAVDALDDFDPVSKAERELLAASIQERESEQKWKRGEITREAFGKTVLDYVAAYDRLVTARILARKGKTS